MESIFSGQGLNDSTMGQLEQVVGTVFIPSCERPTECGFLAGRRIRTGTTDENGPLGSPFPRQRREGPRILIVEDEALVALDLSNALLDRGCETVGIAATEESAIQKAKVLKPDLIVMDIKLEEAGDGIRASRQILAMRKLPILFITAYRDQDTMDRLTQLQPVNILFKPFSRRAFFAAVDAALSASGH